MNRNEVRKFVNEHKAELAAGAGIALSGVLWAIIKKPSLPKGAVSSAVKSNVRNLVVPSDFIVGEVTELCDCGEEMMSIVQNITMSDLGKLGKEFVKHGLAADGTEASVIVEFLKKE